MEAYRGDDDVAAATTADRPLSSEIESRIEHQLGMPLSDAVRVVWTAAIRLCDGDKHMAEDISQEVFEKITKRVISGPRISAENPAAYLIGTTSNTFTSVLRRESAKKRGGGSQTITIDSTVDPASDQLSPDEMLRDDEAGQMLEAAIQSLLPHHRQVIQMYAIEGLGLTEIAMRLGRPKTTVKSQIEAAQRDMRNYLRRSGWETRDA